MTSNRQPGKARHFPLAQRDKAPQRPPTNRNWKQTIRTDHRSGSPPGTPTPGSATGTLPHLDDVICRSLAVE